MRTDQHPCLLQPRRELCVCTGLQGHARAWENKKPTIHHHHPGTRVVELQNTVYTCRSMIGSLIRQKTRRISQIHPHPGMYLYSEPGHLYMHPHPGILSCRCLVVVMSSLEFGHTHLSSNTASMSLMHLLIFKHSASVL